MSQTDQENRAQEANRALALSSQMAMALHTLIPGGGEDFAVVSFALVRATALLLTGYAQIAGMNETAELRESFKDHSTELFRRLMADIMDKETGKPFPSGAKIDGTRH